LGSNGRTRQPHSHERGNRQSGVHHGCSFPIVKIGANRTVCHHTSTRSVRRQLQAALNARQRHDEHACIPSGDTATVAASDFLPESEFVPAGAGSAH
jgi:hypothetical protein